MGFWVWVGIIVGALLGLMAGGVGVALAMGVVGAVFGVMINEATKGSSETIETPPPPPAYGREEENRAETTAASAPATTSSDPAPANAVLARLDAIDARLARIEARLASQGRVPDVAPTPAVTSSESARETASFPPSVAPALPPMPLPRAAAEPARSLATQSVPAPPPAIPAAAAPAAVAPMTATPAPAAALATERAPDGTMQVPASEGDGGARLPDRSASPAQPRSDAPPPRPAYAGDASPEGPSNAPVPALWRWFTGGNALTRIGVVILFFGVAFLLVYFAEIVTVPIEAKLAGAGAGGLALAALGVRLARNRPAYGLSLQGAGMGIDYLVVFAAFRLYDVLPPAVAIVLLIAVSAATVALALRHDSQPLAALALAGGFLAPMLIRTQATSPALLFGYFAILNAAIFALAWRRAWRPLNVLGFVFTFVLGLFWGYRFYTPAHYPTVQPFLALFFLFYVGIAILYARRGPLNAKAPVDGMLVFGVPIVGFALQMAIVRSHRYGVAWSAGALSAFYALLWFLLKNRGEAGLALLAKSFAVLGVTFGTLAIPFAADPRATSAWWALEAAAVYWLGVVQRQWLARAFALLLQLAAAFAFLIDTPAVEGRLLLNASFLGMALIGLAALASAWVADRHPDALGPRERGLVAWMFAWGLGWWVFAGVQEMRRQVPYPARIDATLAWVSGTVSVALLANRWLQWGRLFWATALLLPAMALAAFADLQAERTTLSHYGWLVWPLAFTLVWMSLRAAEPLHDSTNDRGEPRPAGGQFLRHTHTVSAIALVAWVAWEASEWVGRYTAAGTIWMACATALPAIAYLAVVVRWRDSRRWPFAAYADAYGASAGTTVAASLAVWFAIVVLTSPGDPAPLPYVPLLNPFDLALLAALGALWLWARVWGRMDDRTLYGWLGAAVFVVLNGAVVRTAHHWADVPWRLSSLMAHKPLQAALTLTWTATALALMLWATRKSVRAAWMVGAALLAAVVVKLFAIDLPALSGLTRVVAFMGVGVLLLVIGYVAPLPPARSSPAHAAP